MKIDHEVTLEAVKKAAKRNSLLRYGANTCWWGMDDAPWYDKGGLPSDPRGGMLLQTEKSLDFIKSAEDHVDHYGKYGIRCFLLALHGCVVTDDGKPTCFQTWTEYEALLDQAVTR